MFDDIGKKLMSLAKFISWFGVIVFVIFGFLVMRANVATGITLILTGILLPISMWQLYAFGQIVDDVHAMRTRTEEDLRILKSKVSGLTEASGEVSRTNDRAETEE